MELIPNGCCICFDACVPQPPRGFEKCLTQLFYGWMCIVQALLIPAIHEFGALSKLVCVKITLHSTTPQCTNGGGEHQQLGPWGPSPPPLISGSIKTSEFSTNAQSRFLSVVLGDVSEPLRLSRHFSWCPRFSVVPNLHRRQGWGPFIYLPIHGR